MSTRASSANGNRPLVDSLQQPVRHCLTPANAHATPFPMASAVVPAAETCGWSRLLGVPASAVVPSARGATVPACRASTPYAPEWVLVGVAMCHRASVPGVHAVPTPIAQMILVVCHGTGVTTRLARVPQRHARIIPSVRRDHPTRPVEWLVGYKASPESPWVANACGCFGLLNPGP